MSSAVNLLDPNSQQNATVAIQKLLNIDAGEDVINQATHLYINNFAVAKTNIEDMKSQLFGAKRKIRTMTQAWKKRVRAFKRTQQKLQIKIKNLEKKKNKIQCYR